MDTVKLVVISCSKARRTCLGRTDAGSKSSLDFDDQQIDPFADIPVYLAIGNHELVSPKTRADYLEQFADWLDSPTLRAQRLRDDPHDHKLRTYYHWIQGGIDFISLDNASTDQFDDAQLGWIEQTVARDETDGTVHAIVVGMHDALPDSIFDGAWHERVSTNGKKRSEGIPRFAGIPSEDQETRLCACQPLALSD